MEFWDGRKSRRSSGAVGSLGGVLGCRKSRWSSGAVGSLGGVLGR